MIRAFQFALCLLLTGCSKPSGPASSDPTKLVIEVVVGGVYAMPSHVPTDPYWSIWKVVLEDAGKVWYTQYTNTAPADPDYLRPLALAALTNLSLVGASMNPSGKFVRHPGLHYLGRQPITSEESREVDVCMRSYREAFDSVRNAGLQRR